ncbi:e3 ubiquitin-protein ligase [Nesidiocoris tenuis]|uniref:E3 ubiquitin-protein ligase n=1 Tax=Nesidiocoris tenuis TaxID=355587 RepID=A0ABN7B275_9HEMI|nr:e3 ubiquitin-protein ligase [Nesidiocoris tenuis]
MSNANFNKNNGAMKIRLTILCARNLARRDLFRLPDPFAKISVDGSGQCHSTDTCKATLDPKWNQHYDLYVSKNDGITISVWNHRKIHKKEGGGFLGCVRIIPNAIQRLKDTGYQRLELCKSSGDDSEAVKGQIVISLLSRDGPNLNASPSVVSLSAVSPPQSPSSDPQPSPVNNQSQSAPSPSAVPQSSAASVASPQTRHRLPDGWEERRTSQGRLFYINHVTKTTQWTPPVANGLSRNSDSCLPGLPPNQGRRRSTKSRHNNPHNGHSSRHNLPQPSDLPSGYEMRTTEQGQVYFYHVATGVSSWHDPRVPRGVDSDALNDRLGPLPPGWEARHTPSGRVYYVDHNRRTTQFTHPTLSQYLSNLGNNNDAPPTNGTGPAPASTETQPRVPPTTEIEADVNRDPSKEPIDGEVLPKYKRDLVAKQKILKAELTALQPQSGHCRLEVSRHEIFEESYRLVMKMRSKDLRKRLMVKFRGEEGLDYGGVAREWLYLLSHEMLNLEYGLFQYSTENTYTLQINPDSGVNPEHLSYFHFVGRIIGIAVFHGHYIDGGFTKPFYKMLLNKPITLDDIEEVDQELHRSLTWMLNNDITNVIDTTFAVEFNTFGVLKVHELKTGGKDIQVTEDNKREYVRLYVNYRFMRGIEQQFLSLQKGFTELIPTHLLRPFDENELELIIGGLGSIDIADWKANTRLKHCTGTTPVVVWFWQIVESFNEEMRARLLQFVTGSSRVPLQGFKSLQGSTGASGPRLFTIHVTDAPQENLPKAHTCFNRIDLPAYETYNRLYDKLCQAVEETCGFAVE